MFTGTYEEFFEALRQRESSGDYSVISTGGYLGAYQFGEAALVDLGFVYNDGSPFDNDFNGTFTGKYDVFSVEDFLDSPSAQDLAAEEWFSLLWARIRFNDLEFYDQQTLNGVTLTKSGMIAGAHLLGVGGLRDFILSGGTDAGADGNGTSITEYLTLLGNYETPSSFLNNLDKDNEIAGGTGEDNLNGFAGNDELSGDAGDDILDGGSGDDILLPGDGDDLVRGGDGNDEIMLFTIGADTIEGGDGADSVTTDEFFLPQIFISNEADPSEEVILTYTTQGGKIEATFRSIEKFLFRHEPGFATVPTSALLLGGDEADIWDAREFAERRILLYGGDGDDEVTVSPNQLGTFNGGGGHDFLHIISSQLFGGLRDNTNDPASVLFETSLGGFLQINEFERILIDYTGAAAMQSPDYLLLRGTSGDDVIDGSSEILGFSMVLGDGDDVGTGADGDESFDGGFGNDTILAGGGDDVIYERVGDVNVLNGGEGQDHLVLEGQYTDLGLDITISDGLVIWSDELPPIAFENIETLSISASGDTGSHDVLSAIGSSLRILAELGEGDDTLLGGQGEDRFFGDDGDDVLHGNEGDDLLVGDDGNDVIIGGEGNDYIIGSDGNDYLVGD
ncbi:calcium-binding protein [Parvularcula marina]|uniref:Calcium-binding protein n=1 Tax=Parvularcula marina TaxID=2292771 RepID=A0A371R8A2_9PROT|nr:calcium-binding protein [Parvularcula marina]RFB01675.1 hypothetical protein DX908_15490 [Parvularcula marina]